MNDSVYESDVKELVQNVLTDPSVSLEQKSDEITRRIVEYNKLIERRIQEFETDSDDEADTGEFEVFATK